MKVQRVFSTKQVDRRVRRVSRSLLTNQTNEIRIKRIILSRFLTFAVFALSLPTSVAQDDLQSTQTTEQLIASFEESFEAELTAYAATHTDAQVQAYAQARLNQLTAEGLENMNYRVILSPDAKEDIRSALLWYFQHDTNLPFRFAAELDFILTRIAQTPYQFPLVPDPLWRARMKRFPYLIYFTPATDTVYVATMVHQRRLNPLHRP